MKAIVWVEGIIGSGKTRLTHALSDIFGFRAFLEPVDTNPFLEVFYQDPKRWSFPMQMYLLAHRYAMQQQAAWGSVGQAARAAILDRGLPGDRVFCKLHWQAGNMHELEWQTYQEFYDIMVCSLRVPSLVLYLDVEPTVALSRIQKRARSAEVGIELEYLQKLQRGYFDLLAEIDSGQHAWAQGMQTLRVPWNTDDLPLQPVADEILHCLPALRPTNLE